MTVKHFWKLLYISDKDHKSPITTHLENNIAIVGEKTFAELMKKYFLNITKYLNLRALIISTGDDIRSLTKAY